MDIYLINMYLYLLLVVEEVVVNAVLEHTYQQRQSTSITDDCRLPAIPDDIEFWCKSPNETRHRLCRQWECSGTTARPKCLDTSSAHWTLPVMTCHQRMWSYIPACHPVCVDIKSGRRGACVKLKQCPAAAEGMKKLEQPQICPQEGNAPLVCCPTARTQNQMLVVIRDMNSAKLVWNHFNGSWYPRSELPEIVYQPSISSGPAGWLVVTGGTREDYVTVGTSHIYDYAEDKWRAGPSMNTARFLHCSVTIRNTVYVFGGYDYQVGYLRSVESIDFSQGVSSQWTFLSPMVRNRMSAAAVEWRGDIYVTGGRGLVLLTAEVEIFSSVDKYNVAKNKWQLLPRDMSAPRAGHRLVVFDDEMFAIGGWNGTDLLSSCESYDGYSWKYITPMNEARYKPVAGVLDGLLYVMGGHSMKQSDPIASWEMYDPSTQKWTLTYDETAPEYVWIYSYGIVLDAPHTMWDIL